MGPQKCPVPTQIKIFFGKKARGHQNTCIRTLLEGGTFDLVIPHAKWTCLMWHQPGLLVLLICGNSDFESY